MTTKLITRVTEITIVPPDEHLFSILATRIKIEDEAAGEFITINQSTDDHEQRISIDKQDWPIIKATIDKMFKDVK